MPAQMLARKGWTGSGIAVQPWFRQAVFYELDPVSFQDSNGDGFGDLNGVTERLDYLEHLGVDAIVLSPLALEPSFAVNGSGPPFDAVHGTLDDFDRLIAAASQRHVRVLVDLRLDQARTAAEAEATARFWLSRGVAGFHVVGSAAGAQSEGVSATLDEVRRVVGAAPGERILLLDGSSAAPAIAHPVSRHHARGGRGIIQQPAAGLGAAELVLDREPLLSPALSAPALGAALLHAHLRGPATADTSQRSIAFASDAPATARSAGRLGDPQHAGAQAKAVAMALLTTPATPILYFGQELGMRSAAAAGTDTGEPSPMQWDSEEHGGFTSGKPWVGMGPNAATDNVSLEDADPDSLLNWYRRLIALRHRQAALRDGGFVLLPTETDGVVAWARPGARLAGAASAPAVVLLNLSMTPTVVSLTEPLRRLRMLPAGASANTRLHTLAESGSDAAPAGVREADAALTPEMDLTHVRLAAFGSYAGELTTQRGLESVATPVHRSRKTGR